MKTSKKEERMLILNMVSEGKISVDESVKLLEALNAGESDGMDFGYNNEIEDKVNGFTTSLDNFAKEMNEKAKTTYKDFEPKLKNATKTVVEKTVSVLEDITKSLYESLQNMEKSEDPDCQCCSCENEEVMPEEDKPEEN